MRRRRMVKEGPRARGLRCMGLGVGFLSCLLCFAREVPMHLLLSSSFSGLD
jgi:hypothetical protein